MDTGIHQFDEYIQLCLIHRHLRTEPLHQALQYINLTMCVIEMHATVQCAQRFYEKRAENYPQSSVTEYLAITRAKNLAFQKEYMLMQYYFIITIIKSFTLKLPQTHHVDFKSLPHFYKSGSMKL